MREEPIPTLDLRNLVMFHGSCGHTTITEVSTEEWDKLATQPTHGPIHTGPPNRSRTGSKTRMVYVLPMRYCPCQPCLLADLDER